MHPIEYETVDIQQGIFLGSWNQIHYLLDAHSVQSSLVQM